MGTNHTFKIRSPAKSKQLIAQYLAENTSAGAEVKEQFLSGQSRYISILVPPDRFIKRYFREFYRLGFDARDKKMEDFLVDGRCAIGGVDIYLHSSTPDIISISFVCVSSDMSFLFNDSPGIRAWFVDLCRAGDAVLGMYRRDNCYYEVFWWAGAERVLRISDHVYDHPDTAVEILSDFYPLAFDSWYNVIDP